MANFLKILMFDNNMDYLLYTLYIVIGTGGEPSKTEVDGEDLSPLFYQVL